MSLRLVVLALALPATAVATDEELLWQHRNLGKALYENPATQYEAVEELKKALDLAPDSARERLNYGMALLRAGQEEAGIAELEKAQRQDPSIPHTWFNLGIAYKRASRYDEATRQLERMAELVPDEPITRYNLGVLYSLAGDAARAEAEFERAARLDPDLAGPRFQLATAYRKAGRTEEAAREMAVFRELKRRDADAAVPEDLEWSWYSELLETLDPPATLPPPSPPTFAARPLLPAGEAKGVAVLDADADGAPDLLAWGSGGVTLFLAGRRSAPSGIAASDVVLAVPGDVDNDGHADLALVRRAGVELWHNAGEGGGDGPRFRRGAELAQGTFHDALWLDFDHDYDVDLLLLGRRSRLLRNEGAAGFADRTADFPFVAGEAVAAVAFDLVSDTQGTDLAVAYRDRPGVLYRDRLAGRYEATELAVLPTGSTALAAVDADHDGWTDVLAAGDAATVLLRNDGAGGLLRGGAVAGAGAPLALADLGNRGASDLGTGGGLFHATAPGRWVPGEGLAARPAAVAAADFDGDGRVDLATVGEGGLVVHDNRTTGVGGWLRVALAGRKNLALAPGAEIEVKAGSRYQKKLYHGVPLHFGVADRRRIDAVRISWPNGLIQNETRQEPGTLAVEEAQRLSGSCPMIFTWNGRDFEFVTDVLGVAPLGAAAGEGEVFPVDHDEWIAIAGESLVAEGGVYEIRITEELREVAFLDHLRLVAVDHPATVPVLHNDKFKGPPFPEFRLYTIERRLDPVAARDHRGRDVLARVRARDATYPEGFARDLSGVAEPHYLELDFGVDPAARLGAGGRATGGPYLVLSGWVDWADGSTFLAVAQEGGAGLVGPSLEVAGADGVWRPVLADMGLPAGKPKTIVVDLAGRLPAGWQRLRIATNLAVYWDEVYLASGASGKGAGELPEVRLTELATGVADLRFRGFSRPVVHPERRQPEVFVYADRLAFAPWNQTPGLYTRYGDVRELLATVDDRFVIMGAGDELRLEVPARGLPPLPAGWRRDFLLLVDGWAKDGDANTAHSQTVGPLPYHAMPQYPYAAPHAYPRSEAHRIYREHYNRRAGLRFHQPLAPSGAQRATPGGAER